MKVKPLRVGGLLAIHTLQPVLLVYPRLGREKDSAPSGQGASAPGLRLAAVEQGMAVRNARALLGVPSFLWAGALGSRSGRIGHISFAVKCAGARSAGNPHATCDVA